jgi:predicted AAA+ superfamily ATPase
MFDRKLKEHLAYAAKKFPVVTLTGPRQSGKTTLVKHLFPNKSYVTLEDVDQRFFAKEDPRSFLKNFPHGAIIDEVQHVPDLFSYIQTRVDNNQVMGEFILTGSQNILLSQNISQTLAGRTAVLQLLPCTTEELNWRGEDPYHLFFKGFYPAVHDRDIDPAVYYKSYVNTYVEKDVRNIINVKDLSKFHLFLQLCAGRIGQLFNASAIGSECGINHVTVKSWISILEASYVLFLLKPHHQNFNKRLTKQPKLYFYDTGLAAYLLGIESSEILSRHFVRGPIFENYVASELIKFRFNKGMESNIYFWRDHHGREVDFVIDKGTRLDAIEVKSAATITKSFFEGLNYWNSLSPDSHQYLIYGGEMHQDRSQIKVLPWKSAQQVFD